ncbi:MAG: hypothetical protein M3Y25_03290, partial [Thermoproteota archaeon]|nr:hypothetical protein [Thermoproteota archaeon]
MIKNLGIIFPCLLILLLLSNIHYNTSIQVLGQNTSDTNNNSETAASPPTTAGTNATSPSSTTKLEGGIKIVSPDKGDLIPLNSNKSLVVSGVSKDNAASDCDVTIIVNNVKPYQNVQPTGIQGNNDYSTWQYTLSSNYTNINEGNNKITSKIFCTNMGSGSNNGSGNITGPSAPAPAGPTQAYYSVNVTATNFTQAQLTNYELMLGSSANATNGNGNSSTSGNTTLTSNAILPVAQIQQFNQDTGNGPVCCKTTSALTTESSGTGGGGSSSSSSSTDDDDDDISSSSSTDDD